MASSGVTSPPIPSDILWYYANMLSAVPSIRNQLREPSLKAGARCIFYRRDDKNAKKGSERAHYQVILSSQWMMEDAVECGPSGHGADGVHKSVEDDIIVDGVLAYASLLPFSQLVSMENAASLIARFRLTNDNLLLLM